MCIASGLARTAVLKWLVKHVSTQDSLFLKGARKGYKMCLETLVMQEPPWEMCSQNCVVRQYWISKNSGGTQLQEACQECCTTSLAAVDYPTLLLLLWTMPVPGGQGHHDVMSRFWAMTALLAKIKVLHE